MIFFVIFKSRGFGALVATPGGPDIEMGLWKASGGGDHIDFTIAC